MDEAGQSDLSSLVGSWRLLSFAVTFLDTGERIEQYGPNPVGWMVLAASGRIMFLFGNSDRQPPANDSDKANLFDSIVAYTGKVRRDGTNRFVTAVDLGLHPAFGGEQTRFFTIDGDRLNIRTSEQTHPKWGDRLLVGDIVWIREG